MLDKPTMIRLIAEQVTQQYPDISASALQNVLSQASEEDLQRLIQAMSRFELKDIFHLMPQLEQWEESSHGN